MGISSIRPNLEVLLRPEILQEARMPGYFVLGTGLSVITQIWFSM